MSVLYGIVSYSPELAEMLAAVMEPLLSTEDVAEFFKVDVVTVRRMINKGS